MADMVEVNKLREPTRRHLGLNKIEIEPKEGSNRPLSLSSKKLDLARLDNDFSSKDYGLSKEILAINEKKRNLTIDYDRKAGESYPLEYINLNFREGQEEIISEIDILAEEGSSSNYLVNISGEEKIAGLLNSVIRLDLKKNSKVKLVVVTDLSEKATNYQAIASIIGEDAELDVSYVELGSGDSLVNIKTFLDGARSAVKEDGIYFKVGDEKLDLLTVIEHHGRDTASETYFNGALKDRARKNFKGVVDLKRGCVKADGKIGDYSMMLSSDAVNKSTPILLNEEKDVAGKHAASVGRINPDILFYIMSRGFSKKQAQSLMLEANFAPTLDKIEDEKLREELKATVHKLNRRDD